MIKQKRRNKIFDDHYNEKYNNNKNQFDLILSNVKSDD